MAKRGKGEGQIRKRTDGRYEARIVFTLQSGEKKRFSFYGDTRRAVLDELNKAKKAQEEQQPIETSQMTVASYLGYWVEEVAKGRVKFRTYDFYASTVRNYLTPALGAHKLPELTHRHLEAMYGRLGKRVSPRTVHHCHAVIKNALNHAVKTGMVGRNVAMLVDSPRAPKYKVKPFNPEQAQKFLQAARDERLFGLYLVALTTGLRQGELFGLKWEDVDLERGVVAVRNNLVRRKGWKIDDPKSDYGKRSVAIPPVAVQALQQQKRRQAEEKASAKRWEEYGLVFTTVVGTPLSGNNVQNRSFKPLLRANNLPDIHFHDLRHTTASLLLMMGEHPKVVQEMMGHSSITITMDTYSHLANNIQRGAADKLQGLLGAETAKPQESKQTNARNSIDSTDSGGDKGSDKGSRGV